MSFEGQVRLKPAQAEGVFAGPGLGIKLESFAARHPVSTLRGPTAQGQALRGLNRLGKPTAPLWHGIGQSRLVRIGSWIESRGE